MILNILATYKYHLLKYVIITNINDKFVDILKEYVPKIYLG